LPLGLHASISGSNIAHCASVSIDPPPAGGAKRPLTKSVQARTGRSGLPFGERYTASLWLAQATEAIEIDGKTNILDRAVSNLDDYLSFLALVGFRGVERQGSG